MAKRTRYPVRALRGGDGNRTRDGGFAVPCLTTWLPRRVGDHASATPRNRWRQQHDGSIRILRRSRAETTAAYDLHAM